MSPVRMGVLVSVSLVAAIGLALVARTIASSHERKAPVAIIAAPAEKPMARVLVAKHDLNPGDKLTAADFGWQALAAGRHEPPLHHRRNRRPRPPRLRRPRPSRSKPPPSTPPPTKRTT